MPPANLDRQQRLRSEFAKEELHGLRLGFCARLVALGIVAVWIGVQNPYPDALYFSALLLGFVVLGWLPYNDLRRGHETSWPRYAYIAGDMALLAFTLLFPNPFSSFGEFPAAVVLRFGNEIYFFILIVSSIFYYAPRIVMWAGAAAAIAWSAGVFIIALQPDTVVFSPADFDLLLTSEEQLAYLFQPAALNLGQLITQVIVFLLAAGVLAVSVRRTRALVFRHAEAERARSNLARHFSPNMVKELANMDEPLGEGRSQDVGVLFADVVGFSGIAESVSPPQVLELLRELHAIMGRQVFAHDGTIDKYQGDGIMATFGMPRNGDHDAANALACARGILEDVAPRLSCRSFSASISRLISSSGYRLRKNSSRYRSFLHSILSWWSASGAVAACVRSPCVRTRLQAVRMRFEATTRMGLAPFEVAGGGSARKCSHDFSSRSKRFEASPLESF